MVIAAVWLRFASLRIGYSRGTRIAEKTAKNMSALKKASVAGGAFMLGAVSAVSMNCMSGASLMITSGTAGFLNLTPVRAFIGLGMTMLLLYLLERKNWSLGKCAVLVLAAAALIACFVILAGSAAL